MFADLFYDEEEGGEEEGEGGGGGGGWGGRWRRICGLSITNWRGARKGPWTFAQEDVVVSRNDVRQRAASRGPLCVSYSLWLLNTANLFIFSTGGVL